VHPREGDGMRASLVEASWLFQTREVQHSDGQHPVEGHEADSVHEDAILNVGLGVGSKWFGLAEEARAIDRLE
jgi:hypothetical protein